MNMDVVDANSNVKSEELKEKDPKNHPKLTYAVKYISFFKHLVEK